MKSFSALLKEINDDLFGKKTFDFDHLILLANKVIYHLLMRNKLVLAEKVILIEFCSVLHTYTGSMDSNASKYAKEFDQNTCDYKIVRELLMKFKGNYDFNVLATWANHYYYDALLWNAAIEQMIKINEISGLVYAIGHTQAQPNESRYMLRQRYIAHLKALNPTWRQIKSIVINTMMPLDLVKDLFEYTLEKGLLKDLPEEEYYLYLWNHTIKNAKSVLEHCDLAQEKKHYDELHRLAKIIADSREKSEVSV